MKIFIAIDTVFPRNPIIVGTNRISIRYTSIRNPRDFFHRSATDRNPVGSDDGRL